MNAMRTNLKRMIHQRRLSAVSGKWLCVLGFSLLQGCSLAPVYKVPEVGMPSDAWKDSPWQPAQPGDELPHGNWWQLYGDNTLNELQSRIDQDSPSLAAALARYDQATAYVNQLSAGLGPSVDAGASATRNRQSNDRPLRGSNQPNVYDANTVGVGASYDFDIWGKVRNQVAAGKALAQASAADLETIRLSLHAQLADYYFRLRGVDEQAKLLNDTVKAYGDALRLTQNRHEGGVASGVDVARAQTQLSSVRAEIANIAAQRAIYDHAIASLIGQPAMSYTVPAMQGGVIVPQISSGIPSTLLQRRPDIAAAERRAAAANATIGVARAAYYPDFTIDPVYGFQNTGKANLLSAPYSFWTLGPGVLLNLFDSGLRDAELAQAKAAMDQAAAEYRGVVLTAFQQVEDDLSNLKYEREGELDQIAAAQSASRSLELVLNRYREGAVNYLDVVTAQAAALAAERNALDLHTQQLRASVDLIRALGGGWDQNQSGSDTNSAMK